MYKKIIVIMAVFWGLSVTAAAHVHMPHGQEEQKKQANVAVAVNLKNFEEYQAEAEIINMVTGESVLNNVLIAPNGNKQVFLPLGKYKIVYAFPHVEEVDYDVEALHADHIIIKHITQPTEILLKHYYVYQDNDMDINNETDE